VRKRKRREKKHTHTLQEKISFFFFFQKKELFSLRVRRRMGGKVQMDATEIETKL
jgi:hypothetical protein